MKSNVSKVEDISNQKMMENVFLSLFLSFSGTYLKLRRTHAKLRQT